MASQLAAEALLAATGVMPLLQLRPKPVTMGQVSAAKRVPKEILRLLAAFLDSPKFHAEAGDAPEFDYDDALAALDTPEPGVEGVTTIIERFEDQDLAQAYLLAARAGANYLRSIAPRQMRRTMLGAEAVRPSEFEVSGFRRQWQAVQDPLSALRDLVAGTLMRDQVRALQGAYPALYDETKKALLQLVVERRAKDTEWTLPYRKELVIEILVQSSVMDPAFQRELQSAAAEQDKGEAQPAFSRLDVQTDGMQTPTQRVEAR